MSSDPIRRLKTYGRDLSTIPISRLPKSFERACFICVNTYKSYRLNLGTGPINDAVSIAKMVKNSGFEVFFLHNPHSRNFLTYLDAFFSRTSVQLVFFYVGHGTSVRDTDGDEDDGFDEALVFDDGVVIDDDLVQHLIDNKHPESELTLITDACHSGTVWDIQAGDVHGRQLPPGVMSVSAAADAQTAKQTMIDRLEQGVFTYNLCKQIKANRAITPSQLQTNMRKVLRTYGQTFTVGTTSPEFLNEPFLR